MAAKKTNCESGADLLRKLEAGSRKLNYSASRRVWSATSGGVRVLADYDGADVETKVSGKWRPAVIGADRGEDPKKHAIRALQNFRARCSR